MSPEPRPRLLLIDDEPDVRVAVGKGLEVAGYEVLIAKDGEEALEKVKERPDIIILDLMLPKRSGLEVCATIRKDAAYDAIPIILYTGKENDDVIARFRNDPNLLRQWGADAYVQKLDGSVALVAQIKKLLARPRTTRDDERRTA